MMDQKYEGIALIVSCLVGGMFIGFMLAPTWYAYLERVRSAQDRFELWLKEGDELDKAVRGDQ